jgi:hypothetical protein
MFKFRGLLQREPSRIDGILKITAEDLNLGGLKDLFTQVAEQQGTDAMAAPTLRRGRIATAFLLRQIKTLVNQHFQWQNIDRSLWEAEGQLQNQVISDASDFDALWAGIKGDMAMMIETEAAVAHTELLAKRDAVDSGRVAENWQGLQVVFARFSRAARMEFVKVDSSLKTLAGEVIDIGISLQDLLNS